MSKENVEVVRRIWDAADRRDTEAVFSLYDPEVELDVSGFPVVATNADCYRGHEGLRRLFTEWREIWSDADSDLVELIDTGDRVVSISNGKAVRVEWFTGRKEALDAVGLRE